MQSLRTDDILILPPYHYSYSLLSTPRFPMDQTESAIVEVVDVGVSVSVGVSGQSANRGVGVPRGSMDVENFRCMIFPHGRSQSMA